MNITLNVINKMLNSILDFTRSQCSCIDVGVTCSNLGNITMYEEV